MKTLVRLSLLLMVLTFSSCQEKSLQKYMVEKQDDPNFVKFDVAPSLLMNFNLTSEQKEVLGSIKKINVVSYIINDHTRDDFEKEREEVEGILDQAKYKDLTRMRGDHWNASIKFTGEENSLDEVIVYGTSDEKGFAIFRLHGKNMKPDYLIELMELAMKGDLDLSSFSGVLKVFGNSEVQVEKDTIISL